MADIARATGKGKSSLYYYCKSKVEIFEALLDREIDRVLAQVAAGRRTAQADSDARANFWGRLSKYNCLTNTAH
jgi:AcrR family transcriptional regulator